MITNFTRQGGGGGTVMSVNGATGAVTVDTVGVPLTTPMPNVAPAATDTDAALQALDAFLAGGLGGMTDTFLSTGGSLVNVGTNANLDLDVDPAGLSAVIPASTAAEQAAATAATEVFADIGGVMKKMPISALAPAKRSKPSCAWPSTGAIRNC